MKKKLLFLLIFFVSLYAGFKFLVNQIDDPNFNVVLTNNNIKPENTVFAVDLHLVLFRPTYFKLTKYIFKNILDREKFWLFLINPMAWAYIVKFYQDQLITENEYDILSKKYHILAQLKSILIELINMQELNQESITILETLKKHGYKIYILSNIWYSAFVKLKDKFPVLIHLFDGYFIPSKQNNYAHKPQQIFYEKFKDYIQEKEGSNKQIIFVDNNKDNIIAANKAGLKALRFENATKLIEQINKL